MAIAVPSLTLTITPPGGTATDYTKYLSYTGQNQMQITQNFGRQGDTAVIVLVEEHSGTPSVVIPAMSQISLYDNIAGQSLFAGIVNDPSLLPQGPNLNEWDLNCVDYTVYSNAAIVRWPASTIQAPDQIIVALTNGANCGISAATIADGGYVAPGPTLPGFTLGYTDLTDAWRTLATQMGQVTPFGWFVDQNRILHFYDQSTALPSGVTFTTNPTEGGSTTQGHILLDSQFSYEWNGTQLANRVLVQGATQSILPNLNGNPTDQWLGDGYTTSWPLRYTVTSGSSQLPTSYTYTTDSGTTETVTNSYTETPGSTSTPAVLLVNGTQVQVTAVSSGTAPGAGWSIISDSGGGYFLVSSSPPASGTTLQLWYSYDAPIIAQVNDAGSQAAYNGPNHGVYAEFISDSSLTTVPMALAQAQQDRTEYAYPIEQITFDTSPDFMGWVRAGYTCTVDCALVPDSERNYAWGVSDTFLVTANQVTFETGGYRSCEVTAVRI